MAITKIQSNAFPADVITAVHIADGAVQTAHITDANITHAKLHTDMDLSGKTVTLPTLNSTVNIDVADLFVKDTTGGAQGQVQIGAGTVQGFINIQKGDGTRNVQISSDGDTYFNGGNFGIGTTSPGQKLHVHGSAYLGTASSATGNLYLFNSSNDTRCDISNTGSEFSFTATYLTTAGYKPITFNTGGSEKMRIDSSGNVGIGTSSPSATLTVSKAGNNIFAIERASPSSGSGEFGINVETNSQTTVAYDDGSQLVFGTASAPSTQSGFTERMRIDSSGNVGIGTSSPAEKLHLDSSTNTRLRISTTSTGSVPEIQLYNAAKEWKIGVETSTDAGGGAYSSVGASQFHIKNATDNNPALSLWTDGSAYIHKGLFWGYREDIGRVDQGNTGSFETSLGMQVFQFTIPSDSAWYDVLTNFRECTGYFWATVSDASSRRKKVYQFNRTSPAYGVSSFDLVHDHGGGWNTGDFNFQVVTDGTSSFRLQCQRSSYYSSSNISNGRITFLLF